MWILLLILLLAGVVFSPALNFDFVFDDRVQIANNSAIASWSQLPRYFQSHVWGFTSTWSNYYRPLFLVALRAWQSVVGFDPEGWHVFPIAVHLVNVALVFAVARRLTSDATIGLITSAIFAVHPVHIESVAPIFGVTDPLMAASQLAALYCYLRWKHELRVRWLVFSAALFASALLTKESAVVFPLVLLAYEWTTRSGGEGQSRREPWVFAAALAIIVAAYLIVRHAVLGSVVGNTVVQLPWSTVLLTAPLSLLTFVRLLVAPYGMSSFYNCPYVTRPDLLHFVLPLAALIALVSGIWLWSHRTRNPIILFASLWALLGLLPVLNLRLMQEGDFIHIRFLYVPCAAVSLLLAIALGQVIASSRLRYIVALSIVVALAISTSAQIGFLRNNKVMFQRGVAIAPENRVPRNNLADEYIRAGRLEEATTLLDENLRRHPDFWMSNYNRGYIAYQKKNWPEVDEYMSRAIANHGEQVDAYVYRGFALLKLGRTQEAEQSVRQAIALSPKARSYHFVLGLVLRQEQCWNDALDAFQQELVLNPNDAGAATHVADLRTRIGK
jgi:hypothetical protein